MRIPSPPIRLVGRLVLSLSSCRLAAVPNLGGPSPRGRRRHYGRPAGGFTVESGTTPSDCRFGSCPCLDCRYRTCLRSVADAGRFRVQIADAGRVRVHDLIADSDSLCSNCRYGVFPRPVCRYRAFRCSYWRQGNSNGKAREAWLH